MALRRYCETLMSLYRGCDVSWANPVDTHMALSYDKVQAKNVMRECPVPMGKWKRCTDLPIEENCKCIVDDRKMICPICKHKISYRMWNILYLGVPGIEKARSKYHIWLMKFWNKIKKGG